IWNWHLPDLARPMARLPLSEDQRTFTNTGAEWLILTQGGSRAVKPAVMQKPGSGRLLPDSINSIGLEAIDFVLPQPIDIVRFDARCCLRPHLVDDPPQPRSKRDDPPVFGRAQRLKTIFRRDLGVGNAAVS